MEVDRRSWNAWDIFTEQDPARNQLKIMKRSRKNNCPMSPYSSTYGRFLSFDTFRLKSIKIEPQHQKSIKIDNHKKVCNRLLSISDKCRLISIEFYRQRSIFIDYRNYQHFCCFFNFLCLVFFSCFLQAFRHFLAWSNTLRSKMLLNSRYFPSFTNRLTLKENTRMLDGS